MKVKLRPVNNDEILARQELFKGVALQLLPSFYNVGRLNDWLYETGVCTELLFERSREWALISQAGLTVKKKVD